MLSQIKENLSEIKVTLIKENGEVIEETIPNVNDHLSKRIPLLRIISIMGREKKIDVRTFDEYEVPLKAKSRDSIPKIFGRETEIRALRDTFNEVKGGQGRFVLISGEAGIGKTRLVNELMEELKDDAIFLEGACLYQTGVDPYLPFIDALKKYLFESGETAESVFSDMRLQAPEFYSMLPLGFVYKGSVSIFKETELKSERVRLYEAVTNTLRRIARTRPLVLFIDDIQWGDIESLHLLKHIAQNISENPIMIIGAYRSEELGDKTGKQHILKVMIAELMNQEFVREISLNRLNIEDTGKIIGLHINETVQDSLLNTIYKKSEGNPLFIEEIITALMERPRKKDWQNISDLRIPRTIMDAVLGRVDKLGTRPRKVLNIASVMGESFDGEVLLNVMKDDEDAYIDGLEKLLELSIIEEDSSAKGDSYRFHHGLVQEVVYGNLQSLKKRIFHDRIGNGLEEVFESNLDEVLGELVYHYSRAGNNRKIFEYCCKAGEKAEKVYSVEESIRYYKTALDSLNRLKGKEELNGLLVNVTEEDILTKLGDANRINGNWDESLRFYDKAFNLTDDKKKKLVLSGRIGWIYHRRGKDPEALEMCMHNLELVNEECEEKVFLLDIIGQIQRATGEYDEALEQYEKCLEISEKIDYRRGIGQAFSNIGSTHLMKGDLSLALEFFKKGRSIWEEIWDLREIGYSNYNLGRVYFYKGDFDRTLEYLHESKRISEETGDLHKLAMSLSAIGTALSSISDSDEVIENLERGLKISQEIGELRQAAICLQNIGLIYYDKEMYNEALAYLEKCLKMAKEMNDRTIMTAAYQNIGRVYKAWGELDEAIRSYEKSLEIANELGTKGWMSYALCTMGEAYRLKGEIEKAKKFGNEAMEHSKNSGFKEVQAGAELLFGSIYCDEGEWDESSEHYEESIRLYKELGMEVEQGETYQEFALMLKKKGDIEEAEHHLRKALDIFKKRGMSKRIEMVEKELSSL
jgi:predicted ATPase